MWVLGCKGESGFSAKSTAEEVTAEIDGTGLTAIVTGASSGIGVETTRVLALRGVHVVMAVRNLDAGRKVRDTIVKEVSNAKFDVKELDLSSLASVRKFALEYKTLGFPLNIRINNAGVMQSQFMLSQDNIELHFATNHLDNENYSFSNPSRRIINVSSMGHQLVSRGGIQFDKINDDTRFKYGQSKLANILHANELARRLKEVGVNITVNSLHPGEVITNIVRQKSFLYGILEGIFKHLLKNVQQGAATTCYLALHPRVKGVSGEYFQDNNRAKASSLARDAKLAEKLWDFSLNLNASKS